MGESPIFHEQSGKPTWKVWQKICDKIHDDLPGKN
jgi:hypothetical protein